MRKIILISFIVSVIVLLFNCKRDINPVNPTYIDSETWNFIYNNDTTLKQYNIFKRKIDSSVVIAGTWKFKFDTSKVICPFFDALVAFNNDSLIQFTGNGNAFCAKFIEQGQQNSTFFLKVDGIFKNNYGNGNWKITFTNPFWLSSDSGSYTALKINGSGIFP